MPKIVKNFAKVLKLHHMWSHWSKIIAIVATHTFSVGTLLLMVVSSFLIILNFALLDLTCVDRQTAS